MMAVIVDIRYLDVIRPHRNIRLIEGVDFRGGIDIEPEPAYVIELRMRGRNETLVVCYRPEGGIIGDIDDPHHAIEWHPHPLIEELAPGMHLTNGVRAELCALARAYPRDAGTKPILNARAWA